MFWRNLQFWSKNVTIQILLKLYIWNYILEKYGWLQHDGENFGVQEIIDNGLKLTTSFVKNLDPEAINKGGSWTGRIRVEHKTPKNKIKEIILFLYAGMDENSSGYQLRPVFAGANDQKMTGIVGKTIGLGDFRMNFVPKSESPQNIRHTFHSLVHSAGPHEFTQSVEKRLRLKKIENEFIIFLDPEQSKSTDPNMILYQITAQIPFEIDVVFNPSQTGDIPLAQNDYSKILEEKKMQFNEKFEATFGLQKLGYNQKQITFAQAAMSNMIGGIGYFYGHSLVQSKYNKVPVRYV